MKLPMGSLVAALFAAGCVWTDEAAQSAEGDGLSDVRRVITISAGDGQSAVLADGASSNSVMLNGSRITRLWETTDMPVPLDVTTDAGASAGNAYRQGFVGSSLYTADIPPGSDLADIPLHAQDSLDYIAVLEGEIDLVLPEQSITLRQGDVLVQAGNLHSWANRSGANCRILVVVLTGTRESAASSMGD